LPEEEDNQTDEMLLRPHSQSVREYLDDMEKSSKTPSVAKIGNDVSNKQDINFT
jgi:hypothetical protein